MSTASNKTTRTCKKCGKVFVKKSNVSWASWEKNYKHCSRSCSKRGKTAWNKGKPRTWDSPGSFKKGMTPWNKGRKYEQMRNDNNHNWKGDDASLVAIHNWVARRKGRPTECEFCGVNDPKRMYHWSNISGEYKRDVDDYQRLCVPCHKQYDLSRLSEK